MRILKTVIAALLLFLPLTPNALFAQTTAGDAEPTHFILCLKDGSKVAFLLEHTPKVINGTDMITVVDEDVSIEYPLANVHKYLMGTDADTGIENIPFSNNSAAGKISGVAGNILLSGFDASVPVTVTGIDGINVLRTKTNAEGCLEIVTSQYPQGIYIVKVQNQTFKFIRR